MTRARLRDLGITIGRFPTGQYNAITDVPGVWVGQVSLIYDTPRVARTGVTVVVPREGQISQDFAFAAYHSFNGCGEMTGLPWLQESGMLMSPVAMTNTNQVGLVHDAILEYGIDHYGGFSYKLPVVAETYDGYLNDADAFHITREHVYAALESATSGPVMEGNVGGGTGMICHDFKGGIGTASRVVTTPSGSYTVGALVQSNYGDRHTLRVDGVPVGQEIGPDVVPLPGPQQLSSILVVVATDAPLIPTQCAALARRATVGLSRTGGVGLPFSGDLFLAFSTGNHLSRSDDSLTQLEMLPLPQLGLFFEAVPEAVEEAILNALVAAETMTGYEGHTVYALPLDRLRQVMARYRPATGQSQGRP